MDFQIKKKNLWILAAEYMGKLKEDSLLRFLLEGLEEVYIKLHKKVVENESSSAFGFLSHSIEDLINSKVKKYLQIKEGKT